MRPFLRLFRSRVRSGHRTPAIIAGIYGLVFLAGCAPTSPPPGAAQASVLDSVDIVTLDVGGTAIRFAPIDGWCVYPPERMARFLDTARVTSADLVTHAYFGDCGQIQAAEALDGWVVDDGNLGTPKEVVRTDLGSDRAAFVDRMAVELRRANFDQAIDKAHGELADALGDRGVDLDVGETKNLGIVDQDQNAVYFAIIQNGQANSINRTVDISRLTVGAATLVRGRMILLNMSSDYEPGKTLEIVLGRSKAQVERLISLNPRESES